MGSLTVDAGGNVATIVTGVNADFGDGPQGKQFHVIKLDPTGDVIWARHYHSAVQTVAFDPAGNLVITGHMSGGEDLGAGPVGEIGEVFVFVVELDSQGSVVWTKTFPRDFAIPYAAAVDSAGAIYLGGQVDGFLDLGATTLLPVDYDAFLVKLDATGNHVWSTLLGGTNAYIDAIALDANDQVVVAGEYKGEPAAWGLADAGVEHNGFLAKLDVDGDLLWSFAIDSGGGAVDCMSVAVDASGSVSLGGEFQGSIDLGGGALTSVSYDAFVARFDASGAHIWSTNWVKWPGGRGEVWATPLGDTMVVGGVVGDAIVGGKPLSSGNELLDVLLASFQPDGTLIDATLYGDAGHQWGESLVVDPSGRRIVRGRNFGTLDFGSGLVTTSMPGGDGFYVAMLAD